MANRIEKQDQLGCNKEIDKRTVCRRYLMWESQSDGGDVGAKNGMDAL